MEINTEVGPIGAEIRGIDLSQPLSASAYSEIHEAWLRHGVLFFRDQTLSPSAQAAFAEHFGELDVYPFMQAVTEHENVIPIVKEADATLNFGGDWHTDTSYKAVPPKATLLYAVEVPPTGGDTLFADATAAFSASSPAFQETLSGLSGMYTPKMVHGKGAVIEMCPLKISWAEPMAVMTNSQNPRLNTPSSERMLRRGAKASTVVGRTPIG